MSFANIAVAVDFCFSFLSFSLFAFMFSVMYSIRNPIGWGVSVLFVQLNRVLCVADFRTEVWIVHSHNYGNGKVKRFNSPNPNNAPKNACESYRRRKQKTVASSKPNGFTNCMWECVHIATNCKVDARQQMHTIKYACSNGAKLYCTIRETLTKCASKDDSLSFHFGCTVLNYPGFNFQT